MEFRHEWGIEVVLKEFLKLSFCSFQPPLKPASCMTNLYTPVQANFKQMTHKEASLIFKKSAPEVNTC